MKELSSGMVVGYSEIIHIVDISSLPLTHTFRATTRGDSPDNVLASIRIFPVSKHEKVLLRWSRALLQQLLEYFGPGNDLHGTDDQHHLYLRHSRHIGCVQRVLSLDWRPLCNFLHKRSCCESI